MGLRRGSCEGLRWCDALSGLRGNVSGLRLMSRAFVFTVLATLVFVLATVTSNREVRFRLVPARDCEHRRLHPTLLEKGDG